MSKAEGGKREFGTVDARKPKQGNVMNLKLTTWLVGEKMEHMADIHSVGRATDMLDRQMDVPFWCARSTRYPPLRHSGLLMPIARSALCTESFGCKRTNGMDNGKLPVGGRDISERGICRLGNV